MSVSMVLAKESKKACVVNQNEVIVKFSLNTHSFKAFGFFINTLVSVPGTASH